jgi:riboflavin kinase/FMN adenylyltransferase
MELIRGIQNIRPQHFGCALTIGNFDGVHLGHQQILSRLVEKARSLGVPAMVMVFEPQPLERFAKDKSPARISQFRDKYRALKALGIDILLCVRFSDVFAQMQPAAFIELLCSQLGVQYLVVGDDFRFGKSRAGDFDALLKAGHERRFDVVNTQSFCSCGHRVSSTRIRQALALGDFVHVHQLLGRPYRLAGKVVHGQKLGRQLGFPTANIRLKRHVAPLRGVFAVKVVDIAGQAVEWPAIANIGYRPSANGQELLLEVHVFNCSQDLYTKRLTVEPIEKLRDELKFDSLDALKAQVFADMQRARSLFGLTETI